MRDLITSALEKTVDQIDYSGDAERFSGKIRENFIFKNEQRAIVVTDRISAFDFILGTIPFKGQVLNQIAAWWFKKLDGIVPHHLISMPDPNISLVKNVDVLPVEIVIRGYLTGTTKTSSWYAYQNLDRVICGVEMPEGMKKNEPFAAPILTPTTKGEQGAHDESITPEEILARGLVAPDVWEKAVEYVFTMFEMGQKVAAERGLILVDTKYEMGLTPKGELIVIDEVHTPDSSRYWIADTYEARMAAGDPPDMLDKEFVRKHIVDRGYNVDDESQNPGDFLDDELRTYASERYIDLFYRITGEKFQPPEEINGKARIEGALYQLATNN